MTQDYTPVALIPDDLLQVSTLTGRNEVPVDADFLDAIFDTDTLEEIENDPSARNNLILGQYAEHQRALMDQFMSGDDSDEENKQVEQTQEQMQVSEALPVMIYQAGKRVVR